MRATPSSRWKQLIFIFGKWRKWGGRYTATADFYRRLGGRIVVHVDASSF
jgi:hypothetical protein